MSAKLPKSKAKTAYELLSEVCVLIMNEPLRYDQQRFIARKGGKGGADDSVSRAWPSCGTVGCVAGWVATLKTDDAFSYNMTAGIACNILGIDYDQSNELFNGAALRKDPKRQPKPQTVAHARAGVAHIRKFQKKYRAQLLRTKVRR